MAPPKNDDAAAAEELVDYEEEPEVAEAEKGKVRVRGCDRRHRSGSIFVELLMATSRCILTCVLRHACCFAMCDRTV